MTTGAKPTLHLHPITPTPQPRRPVSFHSRKWNVKRASFAILLIVIVAFALNELRCQRQGCISRVGFYGGEKKSGSGEAGGFVGGGSVVVLGKLGGEEKEGGGKEAGAGSEGKVDSNGVGEQDGRQGSSEVKAEKGGDEAQGARGGNVKDGERQQEEETASSGKGDIAATEQSGKTENSGGDGAATKAMDGDAVKAGDFAPAGPGGGGSAGSGGEPMFGVMEMRMGGFGGGFKK